MNKQTSPREADEKAPVVFIVDDEAPVRDALASLFRSVGIQVETYPSAATVLERKDLDGPCCLLLNVRLEGLSGVDLQRQLLDSNNDMPIIFMTGHGDIPMSVKAMKAGALDFMVKPFRDQDLVDAVSAAFFVAGISS